MIRASIQTTGIERTFQDHEIIVSKTDLKGIITYANQTFCKVSGYNESELLGRPHNLIRHPDMPRCVFKFLWDTISAGNEIFAYVINLCKNGDHYWVFAHVTPSFSPDGSIIGYHSSRRTPDRSAVEAIIPLYKQLCEEENSYSDWRDGMSAATNSLITTLENAGVTYDEFVFSI